MGSIYRITPSNLRDDVLRTHIYPNLQQELYWDDSWDPDFYVELARAGFISIAIEDTELGPLLVPEMQKAYAVLDWDELHCSRNLRRLLRSERLAREDLELRVVGSVERVIERLVAYHYEKTWIIAPYRELVAKLPRGDDPRFAMKGVELWSRAKDELVAGELGYTIGAIYTSLSGFCTPDDPARRHFGTLQLYLLAQRLRDCGYAFWNMGHPSQPYKRAIGARITPRKRFLKRWFEARDAVPRVRLRDGCG